MASVVNTVSAPSILRCKEVLARTGLKKSTFHQLVKDGKFASKIELTPKCVGWLSSEVDSWIDARIAETRGVKGGNQ